MGLLTSKVLHFINFATEWELVLHCEPLVLHSSVVLPKYYILALLLHNGNCFGLRNSCFAFEYRSAKILRFITFIIECELFLDCRLPKFLHFVTFTIEWELFLDCELLVLRSSIVLPKYYSLSPLLIEWELFLD